MSGLVDELVISVESATDYYPTLNWEVGILHIMLTKFQTPPTIYSPKIIPRKKGTVCRYALRPP